MINWFQKGARFMNRWIIVTIALFTLCLPVNAKGIEDWAKVERDISVYNHEQNVAVAQTLAKQHDALEKDKSAQMQFFKVMEAHYDVLNPPLLWVLAEQYYRTGQQEKAYFTFILGENRADFDQVHDLMTDTGSLIFPFPTGPTRHYNAYLETVDPKKMAPRLWRHFFHSELDKTRTTNRADYYYDYHKSRKRLDTVDYKLRTHDYICQYGASHDPYWICPLKQFNSKYPYCDRTPEGATNPLEPALLHEVKTLREEWQKWYCEQLKNTDQSP
jgi:hypothetical protein